MRHISRAGVLFLALGVSSSAWAQAAGGGSSAAPKAGVNDEIARGLFQAGKAAYEAGNYKEALQFFEQAYERSGRVQMFFNIGQVADRLRQDEKALSAFRRYLQEVPEATNRAEVESRIAALEQAKTEREKNAEPQPTAALAPAQVAAQAQPAPDAQEPEDGARTSSDDQPITKKWWFWTGIGAVVVGGTAIALAVALGGDDGGTAAPFEGSAGSLKGP